MAGSSCDSRVASKMFVGECKRILTSTLADAADSCQAPYFGNE